MFKLLISYLLVLIFSLSVSAQNKLVSTESSRTIIQPYITPLFPINIDLPYVEKGTDIEMHSSYKLGIHYKKFSPVSVLGWYADIGYSEQMFDIANLDTLRNVNLTKKGVESEIGISLLNPSIKNSTHLSLKLGLSMNVLASSYFTSSEKTVIVRTKDAMNRLGTFAVVRAGWIQDIKKVRFRAQKLTHLTFDINAYIPLNDQLTFSSTAENPYVRELGRKELFTSYLTILFGLGFDLSKKYKDSFELDVYDERDKKHFLPPYFNNSTKNWGWISGFNVALINRNYVAKYGNRSMLLNDTLFNQKDDILNPSYSYSCAYVFANHKKAIFYSLGVEHIWEQYRFANYENAVHHQYLVAIPIKFGFAIGENIAPYLGCDLAYLYATKSRNIDIFEDSENNYRLNYNVGIKIAPSKLYIEAGASHMPLSEQLTPYVKIGMGI